MRPVMKQFVSTLRKLLRPIDPRIRAVIVGVVGGLFLLAGVALIFLPGPAIVVIPVGIGILATEFPSVRQRVHRAVGWIRQTFRRFREKRRRLPREVLPLI